MDALAGNGVQVGRERGDEGLSLASPHFGDHPPVKDDTTHELHGEVPHPQRPPRCLPHGGEGLREQLVEGLSPPVTLPEVRGHAAQFLIRHGLEAFREVLDLASHPLELLLVPALAHREGRHKQPLIRVVELIHDPFDFPSQTVRAPCPICPSVLSRSSCPGSP